MKRVGVCGHFSEGAETSSGQIIKTRTVTAELIRQFGIDQVVRVDSHGGVKAVPRMVWQSFRMFRNCSSVVMLPADKGLRVFTPVYSFYHLFFRRKILYVVIGGWLPSFLDAHRWLQGMLKKFDGIFVETATMKSALESRGFTNVSIMPNFKDLPVLKPEDLTDTAEEPYKLCTFSRVMKEKGIEDAIHAVTSINRRAGRTIYRLDIYGCIEPDYRKRFAALQKAFPAFVQYKGNVPYSKSAETLKEYFALLFPTQFYTEGIPGTIIDSYAAGVPVIASKWESFADAVDDGATGIGYEFSDAHALEQVLAGLADHPEMILKKKKNCLVKAQCFTPEASLSVLLRELA